MQVRSCIPEDDLPDGWTVSQECRF